LINDTFTANDARGGSSGAGLGSAGQGAGGALFVRNGTLTATFDTFSANLAPQGATDVFVLSDNNATSGSSPGTATATLVDDILGQAGPPISDFIAAAWGTAAAPNLSNSQYDIVTNNSPSSGTGLAGSGVTHILTGNPQLGPLDLNGGPTQTFSLDDGSPAIRNGRTVPGISTDQRGLPRSTPPDIGSWEDPPPSITEQPSDAEKFVGETVTFSAEATGDPTPSVQWFVKINGNGDFVKLPGDSTSTTLTLTNLTLSQNQNVYEAVFTNKNGTSTTAGAKLTVDDAAPTVAPTGPVTVTAPVGKNAVLLSSATGSKPMTIQWYYATSSDGAFNPVKDGPIPGGGGASFEGATTPSLDIFDVQLAQNGWVFHATYTNHLGASGSAPITLQVTQSVAGRGPEGDVFAEIGIVPPPSGNALQTKSRNQLFAE
jgi:hypothetical protein